MFLIWHNVGLPELTPYSSVIDALRQTSARLKVLFPDINNPDYTVGDGQFMFNIGDGQRSIQIMPIENRGYYSLEVFDYDYSKAGRCYQGKTTSLEASTIVLSHWFMERHPIEFIHTQFPWMSQEPLKRVGPRMTFE